MPQISYYPTVKDKRGQSTDLDSFLRNVMIGTWQDAILDVRTGKKEKSTLPAVTASGYFENDRQAAKITQHSGFICIDCDLKQNPDILEKRKQLLLCKYVYAHHISASGGGLAVYIKINAKKHLESFLAIEKYFANQFQIIIDTSCKDVSRARFVSYDPEMYLNSHAVTWDIFIPKTEIAPPHIVNAVYGESDIDLVLTQIRQQAVDLTGSYDDWLNIAFALHSHYKDSLTGVENFCFVSQFSPKYKREDAIKQYNHCKDKGGRLVTIGTFFFLAKRAGLRIKSQQTKIIEEIAISRKKAMGTSGGFKDKLSVIESTKEYLKREHNIVSDIQVEQIINSEVIGEISYEDDKTGIGIIKEYCKAKGIYINEITGALEIENIPLTTRKLNTLINEIEVNFANYKPSEQRIMRILESDEMPIRNHFNLFFINNKRDAKDTNDYVADLLSCFNFKQKLNDSDKLFLCTLITKWLVSIVGSMHGTHSVMMLVLIGSVGLKKTTFFRNLLPPELFRYYSELNNALKEADMLFQMCENLLILDDEFGNKNFKEQSHLKNLLSLDIITLRQLYDKLREKRKRYGVLAGTSNDIEVISDNHANRRIIPIELISIDYKKYLNIDKTALFLQLNDVFQSDNEWQFITPNEIERMNILFGRYNDGSREEDLILKYFRPANGETGIFMTSTEMMQHCEQYTKVSLYHKKFGQVLNKHAFEKSSFNRKSGYFVNINS